MDTTHFLRARRVLMAGLVAAFVAASNAPAMAGSQRFCAWDEDTVETERANAPAVADLLAGALVPTLPETLLFRVLEWYATRGFSAPLADSVPETWLRERPDEVLPLVDGYLRLLDYQHQLQVSGMAKPPWLAEFEALHEWLPEPPAKALESLLPALADAHPSRVDVAARVARWWMLRAPWADAERQFAAVLKAEPVPDLAAVADAGPISVVDENLLRAWIEFRLCRFWRIADEDSAAAGRSDLLGVPYGERLGADWRMREDAVRVANSAAFAAAPTKEFYANARLVIGKEFGRVLAADAEWTAVGERLLVSPLRLRDVLVDWLRERGEHPEFAPLYEFLGELCSLAGDRNLAFRAYRMARQLYLEHARHEVADDAAAVFSLALSGNVDRLNKWAAQHRDQAQLVGIRRALQCIHFMTQASDGSRNPAREREFSEAFILAERDRGQARMRAELARQRMFLARHVDPEADVARLATTTDSATPTPFSVALTLIGGFLSSLALAVLIVLVWHRGYPALDSPDHLRETVGLANAAVTLDAAANLPLPPVPPPAHDATTAQKLSASGKGD